MKVQRLGSGTQVVVKWGKGILLRGEGQVKAVETNLLDMAPSINENIARQFTSVVNFFWE